MYLLINTYVLITGDTGVKMHRHNLVIQVAEETGKYGEKLGHTVCKVSKTSLKDRPPRLTLVS